MLRENRTTADSVLKPIYNKSCNPYAIHNSTRRADNCLTAASDLTSTEFLLFVACDLTPLDRFIDDSVPVKHAAEYKADSLSLGYLRAEQGNILQ